MSLFKNGKNTFEMSVEDYVSAITTGNYEIPMFQRKYVWGAKKKKINDLLLSIYKGFNLGTTVFWESDLKINRKIDHLRNAPNDGYYNYIVDGQQRSLTLASVFGSANFVNIDLENIFITFRNETNDLEFVNNAAKSKMQISILDFKNKVLNESIDKIKYSIFDKFASEEEIGMFKREIAKFKRQIKSNKIMIGYKIQISGSDLSSAVSQFEKINAAGIKLSEFDILNAVLFSDNEYKLNEKHQNPSFKKFGGIVTTEGFSSDAKKIILNTFKLFKNYEEINNGQPVISLSSNAISSFNQGDSHLMDKVFKYFKEYISEMKQMGYGSLKEQSYTHNAVLFMFIKNYAKEQNIEIDNKDIIFKIIFETGISKAYDKSASQALIKHIDIMIDNITSSNNNPLYDENILEITDTMILNTKYTSIGPFEKAILSIWLYKRDLLDYKTGQKVEFNGIFKNKNNMDHIFPKIEKRELGREHSLANIAIISSTTNKSKGTESTSEYFGKIPYKDLKSGKMYESQLIFDEAYESLIDGNFNKFISHRATSIVSEIQDVLKEYRQ